METIKILHAVVIASFVLSLICVPLALFWRGWVGVIGVIFFIVFISTASMRDKEISKHLDDLGCEYIGSGKKAQPHISPTKYYKCPDGIIRKK